MWFINILFIIVFIFYRIRETLQKRCERIKQKHKKKQPLPIPVFPISDTEEEDFPAINYLDVTLLEQESTCEKDISVIKSQILRCQRKEHPHRQERVEKI